jgi:branched-chain amino acid transport system substrate-binding protein
VRIGMVRVSALLVVLALVLAACDGARGGEPSDASAPSPADPLGTVEIGPGQPIELASLLGDLGSGSPEEQDARWGMELALDFLDGALDGQPGQILGHPVEVVGTDEACGGGGDGAADPAALPPSQVERLVGAIGPGCADAIETEPVTSLAEAGVVMISPSATDADLTDPATRLPTFFRTAPNALLEGVVVADFSLQELEATRGGVAYDEASANGAASTFRTTFVEGGGIVVVSGTLSSSPADAGRLLRAISLGRPDVVSIDAHRPVCGEAARQANLLPSLQSVPIVASTGCFDPTFVASAGVAPGRIFLAGPDLTGFQQDDFYRIEFLPAYEDQYGTQPIGPFHAHAFDATLILLDAIDRVARKADDGTLTIGRSALRDAVAATSGVTGLSGTITCTPTGDCAPETTIAIYEIPSVPLSGGEPDAEPVFTETVSLADLEP